MSMKYAYTQNYVQVCVCLRISSQHTCPVLSWPGFSLIHFPPTCSHLFLFATAPAPFSLDDDDDDGGDADGD